MERPGQGGQSGPLPALEEQGLRPDHGVQATVSLREDGRILACGGLEGNVIKTVAWTRPVRGQGLAGGSDDGAPAGGFLPGAQAAVCVYQALNEALFRAELSGGLSGEAMLLKAPREGYAGIWTVCPSPGGARRGGDELRSLYPGAPIPGGSGQAGCDWLYVFVLSEDKGMFSPEDRLALVRQGCREFPNVSVHPTMGYLISNATFPTYFLKDRSRGQEISCQLDLRFFCRQLCTGSGPPEAVLWAQEPLDPVTRQYNEALQASLPGRALQWWELPRLEVGGQPVSASRVRLAWRSGTWRLCGSWSPDTTYAYCASKLGG